MHSAVTHGGIQRLALINHPQWAAEVYCAQDGKLARMRKEEEEGQEGTYGRQSKWGSERIEKLWL